MERSASAFAEVMHTERAHDAFSANGAALQEFSAKRNMVDIIWKHDYVNRISLPGILQETNAPSIEGNTAVWSEFVNLCYIDDVTMTAESRTVNWWMVVLLSVVLLIMIVSSILMAVRRRRRNGPSWQ